MENGKLNQLLENKPEPKGIVLTPIEMKNLTDFFVLLIEIDRRKNVTTYDNSNK